MYRIPLLLLTLILLISSCGKKEAQSTAEAYYEAIASKNVEKALSYFDKESFDEDNSYALSQFVESLPKKFGQLQSWKLKGWKIETKQGETYCELIYETEYSDYPATEKLILKKKDEQWFIIGIDIDAEGYIEDAVEETAPDEVPV